MTPASIPHFAVPFALGADGHAREVEQGSVDDKLARVEFVLRTEEGELPELPEFGRIDLAPDEMPLDLSSVFAAVSGWVPDAETLFSEDPDVVSGAVDVLAEVRGIDYGG